MMKAILLYDNETLIRKDFLPAATEAFLAGSLTWPEYTASGTNSQVLVEEKIHLTNADVAECIVEKALVSDFVLPDTLGNLPSGIYDIALTAVGVLQVLKGKELSTVIADGEGTVDEIGLGLPLFNIETPADEARIEVANHLQLDNFYDRLDTKIRIRMRADALQEVSP